MRRRLAEVLLAVALGASSLGCGPGVHVDPTQQGTGGQGQNSDAQPIVPMDIGPYDAQIALAFRPCGTVGEPEASTRAYSIDGSRFALGYTSGVVKIYRSADLALLATFTKASTAIYKLAFSPDGTLLASLTVEDPAIEVWRVADGTTVSRIPSSSVFFSDLRFSANGQYLGVTTNEVLTSPHYAIAPSVSVRSVVDGKEVCQVDNATLLDFSSDESLAWVAKDDAVLTYQVATCSITATASLGGGVPFAISPDGQRVFKYYDIATGTAPSLIGTPVEVVAVSAADGQTIWSFPTSGWPSWVVQLSPKGDFIVIAHLGPSQSGDTTLLNASDGTTVAQFTLGPSEHFDRMSPDGSIVVTTDVGNEAAFWRIADNSNVGQIPKSPLAVAVDSVAFSADSTQLAVASAGQVRFWDLQDRTAKRVASFGSGDDAKMGLAFSRDGDWLLGTGALAILSLASGDSRMSDWPASGPAEGRFSADGKLLYTFSDTNDVPAARITLATLNRTTLPDPTSGFQIFTGHLAVSPQGRLAALTGTEFSGCTLIITEFEGAPIQSILFASGNYWVEGLAFSPDGQYVAAGFDFPDNQFPQFLIKVWRVADGAAVSSFATPTSPQRLAFSSDGSLIITASDIWSWRDGTVVQSFLNSHQWYPVVSPDGRMVATTAGQSSVTLWCRP